MALWGGSDADEAKPKWLTTEEKRAVYATIEDGSKQMLLAQVKKYW